MLQSKENVSHADIEKKEQEIEALLKKVLRDPIGDYEEEREKLEHSFKKIQDIATIFGDRLSAVPDTVQNTVEKLRKDIESLFEGAVEELEVKVEDIHDAKISILEKYLNQFDESVQKTPEKIKEITHALKEDVDALVAEKTMQLSEQMDRLPHVHETMEAKIQVLFEALQGDFRKQAEQRQQKHSELLTSFNQYTRSIKDLSSQVTHEVENIPRAVAQRFKEVVDECQLHLKKLNSRHIDHVEEMNREAIAIQERIRLYLQDNDKIIQESFDKQLKILISSSDILNNSFVHLKGNGELILSMLKESEVSIEKELSTLKNELSDVHRNARSHKMVLMVLLIITLFVTCGDGVLEVLKLFQH